jgi:uncharacterized protein
MTPPQTRRSYCPARSAQLILRLSFIAIIASVMVLAGCQSRYIYFPRPYPANLDTVLPKNVKRLDFVTGEGQQVAFWVPPRTGGVPRQIWLGHAGNGSLALDWLPLALAYPATDVGFLLVDYPGYGYCEGSSTPGRILANSEGAVAALGHHLTMTKEELDARMFAFGHSLGAACTLQYVARHPVQKVVIVAPFTSMADMVDHVLFWPMRWFLWHRFDNQKSLEALATRSPPPTVIIIHGTKDEVIPVAMGRRLTEEHPRFVRFYEVPNGNHNGISREIIINCMMDDPSHDKALQNAKGNN